MINAIGNVLAGALTAWLFAAVIHRESHAPWPCDMDCPTLLRN